MTLHTVFFKGNEGGAEDPINGVARWSVLGCQPAPAVVYGEGFIQSKLAFLEHSAAKDLHGKPNTNHFNLFSGDCRSGGNGKTPVEYRGHFELGFGQSLICGKYPYPYPDHCYGVYSSYGPQLAGRMMLPLRLGSDGGPIFVNVKQYNGIIRRRKKRAEAELRNNFLKIRKPYLHLSRHLHAKRRPRGNGGRFLNTKSSTRKEIRSESNSPAGSEVSSDHDSKAGNEEDAGAALDLFQLNNHLHLPFHHHPFPDVGNSAGMDMNMMVAPGNYLKV